MPHLFLDDTNKLLEIKKTPVSCGSLKSGTLENNFNIWIKNTLYLGEDYPPQLFYLYPTAPGGIWMINNCSDEVLYVTNKYYQISDDEEEYYKLVPKDRIFIHDGAVILYRDKQIYFTILEEEITLYTWEDLVEEFETKTKSWGEEYEL